MVSGTKCEAVTVECPLCKKKIEAKEGETRTEALQRHLKDGRCGEKVIGRG